MSIKQTVTNIHSFLSQFTQVYLEGQAPSKPTFPYITYTQLIENWRTTGIIQLRLWDNSNSTSKLYDIVEKLEDTMGDGFQIENLLIHQGSPFVQNIPQEDLTIKCLYIVLEVDFL